MDIADTTANTPPNTEFPLGSSHGAASPSVASLDSSLVQQTKSDIRSLAAEVARLADAPLSQEDFFAGFLPRLCTAMGAHGSCAWNVDSAGAIRLLASHQAPAELFSTGADHASPSAAHRRVLDCVIAEGSPILVPPGEVKLETDRPTNPLSEALIVIPIRIEARVDYLLQVIHQSSGGPTAQRGYLRFVAQMADLMADFLRRDKLREVDRKQQRFQQLEQQLRAVAAAQSIPERLQTAVGACAELVEAEQAFLLNVDRKPRVVAVSGAAKFDARSEPVLASQALVQQLVTGGGQLTGTKTQTPADSLRMPQNVDGAWWGAWLAASERRSGPESLEGPLGPKASKHASSSPAARDKSGDEQSPPGAASGNSDQPLPAAVQQPLDAFCSQLGCRYALCAQATTSPAYVWVLAFAEKPAGANSASHATGLLESIGGLLSGAEQLTFLQRATRLLVPQRAVETNRRQVALQWVTRLAIAGLVGMLAMFPVTQHVAATATLHPAEKQAYYAPLAGTVTEIHVSDGEVVSPGQLLLTLENPQLVSEVEQLQSEQQTTVERLESVRRWVLDSRDRSPEELARLESEAVQLEITSQSLSKRIANLLSQLESLQVRARVPGSVTGWDIENKLLHRPVMAGDLLVATFQPDERWSLQIAVPDHRIGLVTDKLRAQADSEDSASDSENSAARLVHFSLSSHPDQVQAAVIRHVAASATSGPGEANATASRFVLVEAEVLAEGLPIKKDGAIARTVIDCGKVPVVWLVFRDAYHATASRIRMLW